MAFLKLTPNLHTSMSQNHILCILSPLPPSPHPLPPNHLPLPPPPLGRTYKKIKQIFLVYKEIQRGSGAKSYMTKYWRISSYIRKPIHWLWKGMQQNIILVKNQFFAYFPKILSSYMTLHPIPSKFPYIWGKFCFLFYECDIKQCDRDVANKSIS